MRACGRLYQSRAASSGRPLKNSLLVDSDRDKLAAWVSDLDQPDKPRIRAAVDKLIALAARAPEVEATLSRLLDDPQRRQRWPIAYILGALPRPSDAAVRALIESLDHRDPDIRWAVALLLARMAKTRKDIVASFIALCKTGTVNQRRMALYCIRDLHLSDAASLTGFLEALLDPDPTVRVAAVTSLKTRRDADAGARDKLLELFQGDPDTRVQNAAAVTLAQMGSPSQEFLAALEKVGESENTQLRKAAAAALALLENKRSAPTGG